MIRATGTLGPIDITSHQAFAILRFDRYILLVDVGKGSFIDLVQILSDQVWHVDKYDNLCLEVTN